MPKPLKSFGVSPFSVALYENEYDGENGKVKTKSVQLRKNFFDKKEGKLSHQAVSIEPCQIGSVIALLHEMQNEVIEERVLEDSKAPF